MAAIVIKTEHAYPPIPIRSLDWCAWVDGTEDEDMIQGWGPTEQTAVSDLMERLEEATWQR
jgi:hypothetical protein